MLRPVMSGKVHSYAEVRDNWSLMELFNFIEMLDIQADLEKEHYDNMNK